MFEEGEASWPNDLYKADVYVLTQLAPKGLRKHEF